MSKPIPDGYYQDKQGELKPDRRKKQKDRRIRSSDFDDDRRNKMRRKSDAQFLKREHKREIEDALEEFAEDHDQ